MKISLVALFPWVGVSTPVISTIKYLLHKGHSVDLYVSDSKMLQAQKLPHFLLSDPKLKVIYYTSRKRYIKPWSTILRIYHFFNGMFSSDALEFAIKFRKMRYDICIGYDAAGIEHAFLANYFWRSSLIYHNLEFHELNDQLKRAEIKICRKLSLILTQSDLRAKILSRINRCSLDKFKVLYNSSYLEKNNEHDYYFNDLFQIDRSKFIVLINGSIIPETCILEALDTFSHWPTDAVLIIHGWVPNPEIRHQVDQTIKKYPGKMFFSEKFLDFEHKLLIFRSAHLVLIFYSSSDLNHSSAAGSSGKFYDSLMCGRPVIANDIEGMEEMIVPGNVGYVIKSFDALPQAISKCMVNYAELSRNAFHEFDKYSFPESMDKALENIVN